MLTATLLIHLSIYDLLFQVSIVSQGYEVNRTVMHVCSTLKKKKTIKNIVNAEPKPYCI